MLLYAEARDLLSLARDILGEDLPPGTKSWTWEVLYRAESLGLLSWPEYVQVEAKLKEVPPPLPWWFNLKLEYRGINLQGLTVTSNHFYHSASQGSSLSGMIEG